MTLIVVFDAILPRHILKIFEVEIHANLVYEDTEAVTLGIFFAFECLVEWIHFHRLVYISCIESITHFKA